MIDQIRLEWGKNGRICALEYCSSLLSKCNSEQLMVDLTAWQVVLLLELWRRSEARTLIDSIANYSNNPNVIAVKEYYRFLEGELKLDYLEKQNFSDIYNWILFFVKTFCYAHLLQREQLIHLMALWSAHFPDDPLVLRRASELITAVGDKPIADTYRSRLIKQKPNNPHAFLVSAQIGIETGCFETAMNELREGVALFSSDDELWTAGAICLLRQDLLDEAAQWAIRSIQLNSHNAVGYLILQTVAQRYNHRQLVWIIQQIRHALLKEIPPLRRTFMALSASNDNKSRNNVVSPLMGEIIARAYQKLRDHCFSLSSDSLSAGVCDDKNYLLYG